MAKLTTGSEIKHMIHLSLPLMVGILAIFGFNLVDTFYVSQLGNKYLAAISFTFPVVSIMGSIAFGLGLGVTSLISRALGRGDQDKVQEYATDGLSLSFIIVTLLSFVGFFFIDPLFRLLGASEELLPLIREYMEIWFFSMMFIVIPMVGNGAIRATGNTKFPALVMIVAGLINFLLDPIFIFGLLGFPKMELQGAALATAFSRLATLIASLYFLHFKLGMLVSPFRSFKRTWENWKDILELGIPGAINNAVVPLSMALLTKMVASHGQDAVAGFGVATRIEGFIMIAIIGVAASLSPFIGQNWGAKEFGRIKKVMATSNLFTMIWSVFAFIVFLCFSGDILSSFSANKEVQDVAHFYLVIMILTFIFEGIMLNINSSFNAIGRPKVSLFLNFSRVGFVYVPMAYFLDQYYQVEGIFIAGAIANVTIGILAILVFRSKFFNSKTI